MRPHLAPGRLVRHAVWWVQDYAYAAVWQVRAVTSPRDPDRYLGGTGRPVLVIPGVWETWSFLRPMIERLHAEGHPVHVLDDLRWNSRPVEATARDVAAYLLTHGLTDVVIVAHSKGGLIGKYVMALLDETHRVRSMVAVCSPFSGSRYATWLVLPALRAFSPRDATTMLLARDESVNGRITSVFGEFDPHIPEGSELPGAVNVRLHAGGHFRVLAHPRTIATVLAAAGEPVEPVRPV
ncbi:alpha/beta fold hydrolase [Frigoribacterium sp. Leaf44]|uniref:alpha/beta fold hydrolase n=1 Tax=Frigoribacterium sp. Leaf44 TaxID=1736220 RepID=UPI0006FF0A5C|nr:alpha/beta fold hydrolase [Frigoribacterium sp. Leaf44]KQN46087.1 alpha/beta hydrolase [Frigoribacterium sp. Leaf44]